MDFVWLFGDKCDKENGFWSGNVLISTNNRKSHKVLDVRSHRSPTSKVLLVTVLENCPRFTVSPDGCGDRFFCPVLHLLMSLYPILKPRPLPSTAVGREQEEQAYWVLPTAVMDVRVKTHSVNGRDAWKETVSAETDCLELQYFGETGRLQAQGLITLP